MHFMGLDIGTTSISGVVYDVSNGKLLTAISVANNSVIKSTKSWERLQDPEKITGAIFELKKKLCDQYPDIQGIGLTGQMHGILYCDNEGRSVSPLFTWQDSRGALKFDKSTTYADKLSEIGNCRLSSGFGMVTHFYNTQNNSDKKIIQGSASVLCTIQDYAAMRLTNNTYPLMDSTNAASLGLFDIKNASFDLAALKEAGIGPDILPKITESATRIGYTEDKIPVYAACGDNQASFLGSVCDLRKTALLNIGTGGQVSVFSHQFPAQYKLEGLDIRPFMAGGFLLVGASLCGGKSLALLENFFRQTCDMFGTKNLAKFSDSCDYYEIMNNIDYDDNFQTDDNLIVNTEFNGTREDSEKRGSISGISMDNFLPDKLIAGFLKGIISELHEKFSLTPEKIRSQLNLLAASGNGLKKNRLLRQIATDKFQLEIKIPLHNEEAAVGAALVAAVGSGHFRDFYSVGELLKYVDKI